jgi:hypothetical protein
MGRSTLQSDVLKGSFEMTQRAKALNTITITIYAPMIYTAPCIMFWMRAYPLRGEVGGSWALEFSSFLGP